jgi:hypothetical protein
LKVLQRFFFKSYPVGIAKIRSENPTAFYPKKLKFEVMNHNFLEHFQVEYFYITAGIFAIPTGSNF